ncbi:MAG TPA: glycerol-3-phosphate 1-O-acyltransferase PlsY [Candidatus Acidoferrales bacterium]|nr:glycerol-3-phosphate 1-O-acyltransferase PlsY [Candidatus Acidoferrales bacterium]
MRAGLLVVMAYLCGSLPTGAWVGRWAGVDVRRTGSGNIGATNVARSVGARPAVLTLAADVAKGFIPTLLGRALLTDPWSIALVGLAAVFGHLFSLFLRFSGGKGVSTGFGVFLCLAPPAAGVALAVFAAVAVATGYASVASMLAAATLPLACAMLGYAPAVWALALVVCAAIVARHRQNISRLLQGTEPKFQVRR